MEDNNVATTGLVQPVETLAENETLTSAKAEELEQVRSELETENSKAEEAFAAMFGMYAPRFNMMLDKLNNNALRRVVAALINYPLTEPPKFRDEFEKNAFLIGNRLLESKYMLVVSTLLASKEVQRNLEKIASEASTENNESNNSSTS